MLEVDEGTDDDMPELVDIDGESGEGDNRVVCCLEGCHSGGGHKEKPSTTSPLAQATNQGALPIGIAFCSTCKST